MFKICMTEDVQNAKHALLSFPMEIISLSPNVMVPSMLSNLCPHFAGRAGNFWKTSFWIVIRNLLSAPRMAPCFWQKAVNAFSGPFAKVKHLKKQRLPCILMVEFTSQNKTKTDFTMPAFFLDYNLMLFHLSLLAIILFGVVKTIGFYFGLRPSKFLQKISPYDFSRWIY